MKGTRRAHIASNNWAAPSINVLIITYSRFGVLRLMAERVSEGDRSVPGAAVHLIEVKDLPIDFLRPGENETDRLLRRGVLTERIVGANALIVGAPAYFGSIALPVKRFFEDCLTAESAPPAIDRSRPWRHTALHETVGLPKIAHDAIECRRDYLQQRSSAGGCR